MSTFAAKLRLCTYNNRLRAVVRALDASTLLRKVYFRMTVEKGDVLRMDFGDVEALFHTSSAFEYRNLESWFLSWEKDFIDALLSGLSEGDAFLDVGSSRGQFTVPAAIKVGPRGLVIAIEPHSSACRELEANARLNHISNVRVFNVALGDRRGEALLSWEEGSEPSLLRGLSTQIPSASASSPGPGSGSAVATVATGDELLELERLPVPAAIKIDVEGYEYHVLRGLEATLRNRACKLICCEIHPSFLPVGITPETILDFTQSTGFERVVARNRRSEIHLIAHKDSK
jgi:FkbM family methyltransferase